MAICPLGFPLLLFLFYVVLIVCVPFPCGVWDRVWNSIVSVPSHCIFIYLLKCKNKDHHARCTILTRVHGNGHQSSTQEATGKKGLNQSSSQKQQNAFNKHHIG